MDTPYSGKERRVSQDEQLGYIRGKVESIQEELSDFKREVKEDLHSHTEKEDERISNIEGRLDDIVHLLDIQANTHKWFWLTVKSVSAAVFLALTVTFGDIVTFFTGK